MFDTYELWMSRSAVLLWLPRSCWSDPCLQTIPGPLRHPGDAALRGEPFLDRTCVACGLRGVDWFWKVNPLSAARLFRADRLAAKQLREHFPWTAGGIPVVRAYLAQEGPQNVAESDRLAEAGPVDLPPFDAGCVALAQFGEIPRWIGWEKDWQKLGPVDAPAVEGAAPNGTNHPTTARRTGGHAVNPTSAAVLF